MGQPYVGEIRLFAGNFAPAGWMFCDGQLLPISENDTLFNLIGTTYGGDGQSTFALPDLRGRIPLHQGNGFTLAENGGVEQVTLTTQQIPSHNHQLLAGNNGTQSNTTAGNVLAAGGVQMYAASLLSPASMAPNVVAADGGSQPHSNFQPYLGLNFIISLFGVFPSQ